MAQILTEFEFPKKPGIISLLENPENPNMSAAVKSSNPFFGFGST